jgi:hypothetical protein
MPFGLVQVDFDTQRRTMKSSARFYADVIRSSGENVFRAPLTGDRALSSGEHATAQGPNVGD